MIVDINRFELKLENVFKRIQGVSAELRETIGLRGDAYTSVACVEDYSIDKNDLLVKHSNCVEWPYIRVCKGLKCQDLPIKIPSWISEHMLSSWGYEGKDEKFLEKMVCAITSFRAFFSLVEHCDIFSRAVPSSDFVNYNKLCDFLWECRNTGNDYWENCKEELFIFLILGCIRGIRNFVHKNGCGKSCIVEPQEHVENCILVEYVVQEFKHCCEEYTKWKVDIAHAEEHG